MNSELIIKDYRNRKIVQRIKNRFILDFEEIVGFQPSIKQFGNFEIGKYRIWFIDNGFELNIDFMYESQQDVLTSDDMNSALSDTELSLELDKRRDMNYIIIHSFGVKPTGEGFGTLLMTKLLEKIEYEKKFKLIGLTATDKNAIRFWIKMGFKPLSSISSFNIPDDMWEHNLFKYLDFKMQ